MACVSASCPSAAYPSDHRDDGSIPLALPNLGLGKGAAPLHDAAPKGLGKGAVRIAVSSEVWGPTPPNSMAKAHRKHDQDAAEHAPVTCAGSSFGTQRHLVASVAGKGSHSLSWMGRFGCHRMACSQSRLPGGICPQSRQRSRVRVPHSQREPSFSTG